MYISTIVRGAVLCVWEYMKEEHVKMAKKNMVFGEQKKSEWLQHSEQAVKLRGSQEPNYKSHTGIWGFFPKSNRGCYPRLQCREVLRFVIYKDHSSCCVSGLMGLGPEREKCGLREAS